MGLLGLRALYPKKNLSKRRKEDAVFPYLLKQCPPVQPNDVWCVDITYIKLFQGFSYLTALIDMVSRKVMGWCLSAFLDTQSCLEAFEMAIISGWIEAMTRHGIKISMDGKGRWLDNITIERFWRSIKYEEVYLKAYESLIEARQAIAAYMEYYNSVRPHQVLNYKTPNQVYEEKK
jgi:putative transposase